MLLCLSYDILPLDLVHLVLSSIGFMFLGQPWRQGQLVSATADCKLTDKEVSRLLCLSYDILPIFDLLQLQLSSIGVTGSNFEIVPLILLCQPVPIANI